jgi:hypothetical protein
MKEFFKDIYLLESISNFQDDNDYFVSIVLEITTKKEQ